MACEGVARWPCGGGSKGKEGWSSVRGRRRRGAEEGDVRAAWIGAAPVGRRRRRRRRRVGVYGGKTGGGPHESSFCGCRFAPGLSEYLSLLFRQAYSSRSVLFQQIRPSAPAQSSQIKLEQISRGPSKTKAANAAHSVAATTPNLAFRLRSSLAEQSFAPSDNRSTRWSCPKKESVGELAS